MTKQESRNAAFLLCFSMEPFLLWQQCHNMTEENKPTTQKQLFLRVYIKVQVWCLRYKQENTAQKQLLAQIPPPSILEEVVPVFLVASSTK